MPKEKEKEEDVRDVGVFVLIVIAVLIFIGFLIFFNLLSEAMLVVVMLVILGALYLYSPKFIIEVDEYERVVVFRFGRFKRVAGPGWVFLIPYIDNYKMVDLRIQDIDIEPQEVVTKDNIKLLVDALVFIRIADPKAAVLNIENVRRASMEFVRAHLRDVVGKMELEAVISEINLINELLHRGLAEISKEWGVEVTKVEIEAITLPPEVLEAMHERKQAEQRKFAAREEATAHAIRIDAVREAAGKLSDPAMQYLYLQALEKIAEGKSNKIIFPIELTHLADRLATKMGTVPYKEVAEGLREKYSEFELEEGDEDLLEDLKKKKKKSD